MMFCTFINIYNITYIIADVFFSGHYIVIPIGIVLVILIIFAIILCAYFRFVYFSYIILQITCIDVVMVRTNITNIANGE